MKQLLGKNLLSGEIGKLLENEIQDLDFRLQSVAHFKEAGTAFILYINFKKGKNPLAEIYMDIAKALMKGQKLSLLKRRL